MPARKREEQWWCDFRFGRKRIRKRPPVNTRRGAEDYERLLRERLLRGEPLDGEEPVPAGQGIETCAQFFERWVGVYVHAVKNKPSEAESKRNIVRLHLAPFFGEEPFSSVNWLRRIDEFKAHQVGTKELEAKTVNNHLTVLRRALATAVEWQLLGEVPPLKWLKAARPEFDFFTAEESAQLLRVAGERPKYRPFAIGHDQGAVMIHVALKAGLRRGELLALRWDDVDFATGKINVRVNDSRGVITSPKGGRPREVPLSPALAAALKAHRHLRAPWVFCRADGKRLTRDAIKHLVPSACARAGLRPAQWHVLRHSFASQLVMAGVPLKVVQELLGHTTIEMTLRYSHLAPSMHVDAVRRLDEVGQFGQQMVSKRPVNEIVSLSTRKKRSF